MAKRQLNILKWKVDRAKQNTPITIHYSSTGKSISGEKCDVLVIDDISNRPGPFCTTCGHENEGTCWRKNCPN